MPPGPVFALVLAAAWAAPAEAGSSPVYRGELAALFVPVADLGGRWELLREAPTDPSTDATLREAGVRAVLTGHYARYRGAVSQVCSVEIWAFRGRAEAQGAAALFQPPGWRVLAIGNLLISLRGITLERGRAPARGIFDECDRIAELTSARAEARLR